ncbi:MAG: hypothetical protein GYB64_14730 [Chloroflexi bacterium]|nr:hypothetical protein [Chloroflexota bacterium]
MSRVYRVIEGSLVTLFVLQAMRVVFGILFSVTGLALREERIGLVIVYPYLALVAAIVVPWFVPRARRALPELLSISAILAAAARCFVALPGPSVRLYAGIVVIAFGAVYFVSLLRANRNIWVSVVVAGIALDQLLRAYDTYDISLRLGLTVTVDGDPYLLFWLAIQIALSVFLLVVSRLARGRAKEEPYNPGYLSVVGGLGFGSLLALQLIVLAVPNVIARWSGMPVAAIVPWLLLATVLALMPAMRRTIGDLIGTFDEGLQGFVWMFLFVLLVIVGNRFDGVVAAGSLVVAQFMAMMLLWWIPEPYDPVEVDQVGPTLSLGLVSLVLVMVLYSVVVQSETGLAGIEGGSVVAVGVGAVLASLPRLFWREEDPWLPDRAALPTGLVPVFILPVLVLSLLLTTSQADPPFVAPAGTFRVATFNLNGGYNDINQFRLELAAVTIERSLADVVILQEADVGRPVGFGADQVEYLARYLDMYHIYQPTADQTFGMAILSRWPIFEPGGEAFPGPGDQGGVVRGLIQNPQTGTLVWLYGADIPAGDERTRLEHYAVLIAAIGETSQVILAGDFNATEEDIIYEQLMAEGFSDPNEVLQAGAGYTYPARAPSLRYDYVLTRGLNVIDTRQVVGPPASDHRLVVVEVGWP